MKGNVILYASMIAKVVSNLRLVLRVMRDIPWQVTLAAHLVYLINYSFNLVCIDHCGSCVEPATCTNCTEGYDYSEEDNVCLPICSDNCDACTLPNTCTGCQDGYNLS